MYPLIIGLVGHIRSGKSSVAQYIHEKYKYSIASNSDLLREIAKNLDMEPNRDNLKKLGDSIFSVLGNDTLARFRLSQPQNYPIIVDGIRYKEEIQLYRREPTFKLIGVKAPEYTRYERLNTLANQGKDSFLSEDEFHTLKNARSEVQVDELLKLTDTIINNNKTRDDLFFTIDQLMEEWRNSSS
ncbi:AAA family ATPase [Acinetobacter pittii]|uniref:Dephospho-CoA kinase n=1 Tax=Acinetobacter courvalinii TaxID=280147 RepID=N9RKP2_9GAMM|nr:AAA family ATPase [Acinetobacter courvalinii]ENX39757.1 hypothetical protein F888_01243 [Acinetobacter courvalinii]KAB0659756.1 AAA family ATPase [Acinetobacter courvalinii]GGH41197.1 hypothetical protein GCM10007354_28260 [Acinetobacter courvalinii]